MSELCSRCHAPLAADDHFCPVCGSSRPIVRAKPKPPRRGFWLLVGSAVTLALIFGIVAFIYFSAPERQAIRSISRLPNGTPRSAALVSGTPGDAYVATDVGIYVSNDQGESWELLGPHPLGAVLVTTIAPPGLLTAGSDGLWQIGGSNPTQILNSFPFGNVQAIVVDPRNKSRLVAATDSKGIAASGDGGRSWTVIGDNAPAGIIGLAFGAGANPVLFAGTSADGVFASADGRSWINASGFVNGALPTRNVTALTFDPLSGDRYVGPSGESQTGALYAATDLGIFKSIDAGASWSALPFHQPTVALAAAADGSHRLLAIDASGAVYRSADGGATWD